MAWFQLESCEDSLLFSVFLSVWVLKLVVKTRHRDGVLMFGLFGLMSVYFVLMSPCVCRVISELLLNIRCQSLSDVCLRFYEGFFLNAAAENQRRKS